MGATKVRVVTGTRADFGLLHPLIALLEAEPALDTAVVVTGSHLSERFGLTVREVEDGGHRISARIPLPLDDDSEAGVTKATAAALAGFADVFASDRPDLVVILGDRSEALAAATAACLARVPVAHIHGGELTFGAVDDALRHAITKMSLLHFTSTDEYRRRVIQLGEDPSRVFAVGALGVDNALHAPRLSRDELEADLGPLFGERTAVVTFHPVTLEGSDGVEQLEALAAALDAVERLAAVFTMPNADAGNRALASAVERFVTGRPGRARAFSSLGAIKYLSLLEQADVCVGNSSSGIIEAPALGTPTVDIGDRQSGRVRGATVVHCEPTAAAIEGALREALSPSMRELSARRETPYGDGHAAQRIAAILANEAPRLAGTRKVFRDIPVPGDGDARGGGAGADA